MEIQQIQIIRKYLDLIIRKKVLIVGFLLVGMVAGLFYYLSEPKTYEASALLSYQQQSTNPARMSPDEQERVQDIVSTLSNIVTSSSSLESMIRNLDLFKKEHQERPMEDVINTMRDHIEIVPPRVGNTFRITFTGTDPQKTTRAANVLAFKFIEENLEYREERASETYAYSQDELEMAKELLDRTEAEMRDYRLKYYNEMPEQRDNNVDRLNALQDQYQDRQTSIQELERNRILVQDQIAARERMMAENEQLRLALATQQGEESNSEESVQERIERLSGELNSLSNKYTEKHPEIKRLRKEIEHLEKVTSSQAIGGSESSQSTEPIDQDLMDLQIQLKEIKLDIVRLKSEQKDIGAEIEKYEKWIEAAPVRGAEWSSLTREHGELRRHYDFLVSQSLQARSALNLERKQRGSQFTIEDMARVPERPTKPDFIRIMAFAIFFGTAIGGAIAFGLDFLDSSFRDPTELENILGVELICTVPKLTLKSEKIKRKVTMIAGYLFFFLCFVGVFAAMAYYYKAGEIII